MRAVFRLICVLSLYGLGACTAAPPPVYVDQRAPAIIVPPQASSQQIVTRPPQVSPPLPQQRPTPPPASNQLPVQAPQQWAQPPAQRLSTQPQPAVPQLAYSQEPLDASVYRLGSGDAVRIDVLGEADLSLEALIDPSGLINYPFLGTVQAAGNTVRDLELKIRNGLRGGYLVNPDVRVGLARYRPVFVSGQVRQPGSYPYTLGLNVEKAITLAGGVTPFGSTSRIYRQRNGVSDDDRIKVTLDSAVLPGDYIIVEERLF